MNFILSFGSALKTGETKTVKSEISEVNYRKNIYRSLFIIMCESCKLDKELYKPGWSAII
jgi:hypothetical protein